MYPVTLGKFKHMVMGFRVTGYPISDGRGWCKDCQQDVILPKKMIKFLQISEL